MTRSLGTGTLMGRRGKTDGPNRCRLFSAQEPPGEGSVSGIEPRGGELNVQTDPETGVATANATAAAALVTSAVKTNGPACRKRSLRLPSCSPTPSTGTSCSAHPARPIAAPRSTRPVTSIPHSRTSGTTWTGGVTTHVIGMGDSDPQLDSLNWPPPRHRVSVEQLAAAAKASRLKQLPISWLRARAR